MADDEGEGKKGPILLHKSASYSATPSMKGTTNSSRITRLSNGKLPDIDRLQKKTGSNILLSNVIRSLSRSPSRSITSSVSSCEDSSEKFRAVKVTDDIVDGSISSPQSVSSISSSVPSHWGRRVAEILSNRRYAVNWAIRGIVLILLIIQANTLLFATQSQARVRELQEIYTPEIETNDAGLVLRTSIPQQDTGRRVFQDDRIDLVDSRHDDATVNSERGPDKRLPSQTKSHVTPLAAASDREMYTIRLNTYKRNDQLVLSVNHHARCTSVAQIQIVWCDKDEEPPAEIVNHPSGKVVIEKHVVNSLNERFNILVPPPTLGILSIDDDILRPCVALDVGFYRWTKAPNRLVGYDARIHVEQEDGWKYTGLSIAEQMNQYSMTLLRSAFIHRDYLNLYMTSMPKSIFTFVEKKFNCEDIAMTLFVSSLTDGKPPLLADRWAIRSLCKLYAGAGISRKKSHKDVRHQCMNKFSLELGLRSNGSGEKKPELTLKTSRLYADVDLDIHEIGDLLEQNATSEYQYPLTRREVSLRKVTSTWSKKNIKGKLRRTIADTTREAIAMGFIEGTPQWEKRWNNFLQKRLNKKMAQRMGAEQS